MPFFLYMAYQNTHTPLQVPEHYRPAFAPPHNTSDKSMIFGMVACMDESVRNITTALADRGMFERTLLVWSTDNGGHLGNGQNNYPLRGGKTTEFDGGLRQSAFVSGGFLPPQMRGATTNALMHICDWYATFSSLAGVDPTDVPAAAGNPTVPASDGLNMWRVVKINLSFSVFFPLPMRIRSRTLIGVGAPHQCSLAGWQPATSWLC